jgi:hypothetical protein
MTSEKSAHRAIRETIARPLSQNMRIGVWAAWHQYRIGNHRPRSALVRRRNERTLIARDEAVSLRGRMHATLSSSERKAMNVNSIEGLMRAMELEGTARIDIIRIGKDIQTAGYARRLPSVQQYDELRRAVVQWQRIADDIGRIMGSG